jgi:hypothetical protein
VIFRRNEGGVFARATERMNDPNDYRAPETIDDLAVAYRDGALGTSSPDPKVANRWQRKMHGCYKKLGETPEGRAAIIALMADPSPHVKCWASAHSLHWQPKTEMRTLEELRAAKRPCSFAAELTMEEFKKGRLSFDY